jgi:hypothetical protein
MGTRYPTAQERAAIQQSADKGDTSAAKNYLKLLDACTSILESSNGISLARGLVGEHNDVYGQAIDDALSELVPVILDIAAGGWESLRFYARPEQMPEASQNAQEEGE